ncbi:helix-turn-helix transcriptional regulator [Chitinilyticum aquatile]|uniref:helix-turn-helix transcriptional regulator n=1 Tax=Chitinilyticum aquatile TaxID=362520 RepID=UPI000412A98A|nr:helix-turn-helix transcriptional regulator [Chitinilyticum aquatile]
MPSRSQELADFLKTLRQRCDPASFGFASGSRRRTQGLRREELAQLAGISPTWYTWIEQAREVSMSAAVLDRLASALRMDKMQRGYLFELAGKIDPQPYTPSEELNPLLMQQIVDQIASPAYLLGRYWDVLAWNTAAARLFHNWPRDGSRINLLEYVFFDAMARTLVADWETRSRRLVAEFRAESRSLLDDPQFSLLLQKLEKDEHFHAFWRQHDVLERQGGERLFSHPDEGMLSFQQISFGLEQPGGVKLVMLIPASAG